MATSAENGLFLKWKGLEGVDAEKVIAAVESAFGAVSGSRKDRKKQFMHMTLSNEADWSKAVAAASVTVEGQSVPIEATKPREPKAEGEKAAEGGAKKSKRSSRGGRRGGAKDNLVAANSIYVAGLASGTESAAVSEAVAQFGAIKQVTDVRTANDKDTCYAFVEFETSEAADAAVAASITVNGTSVTVEKRKERAERKEKANGEEKPKAAPREKQPSRSIKVFNLLGGTSEDAVVQAFATFGETDKCLVRVIQPSASVYYTEASAVTAAVAADISVGGSAVEVEAWKMKKEDAANGVQPTTVHVKGFSSAEPSEADIRSALGSYGEISNVVIRPQRTYAEVRFKDAASAAAAVEKGSSVSVPTQAGTTPEVELFETSGRRRGPKRK